jgi:hypothetical protein
MLPSDSRSAMMPEPITVAKRKNEPMASAASRRGRLAPMAVRYNDRMTVPLRPADRSPAATKINPSVAGFVVVLLFM